MQCYTSVWSVTPVYAVLHLCTHCNTYSRVLVLHIAYSVLHLCILCYACLPSVIIRSVHLVLYTCMSSGIPGTHVQVLFSDASNICALNWLVVVS